MDTRGPPARRRGADGGAPHITQALQPADVLLVVDAMTGQDAVNVAEQFARGRRLQRGRDDQAGRRRPRRRRAVGQAVTGKPILFASTGEKLDGLEPFHPDRMASRILGMGDVLTLIEKAEEPFDENQADDLQRKLPRTIHARGFPRPDEADPLGHPVGVEALEASSFSPVERRRSASDTALTDSAAPPRASPSSFLITTPSSRRVAELLGDIDSVLAGHGVDHEQRGRPDLVADLADLPISSSSTAGDRRCRR